MLHARQRSAACGVRASKEGSVAFGEKLKVLMRELDLTQSELSALTGVGKSSISQYLSGKK